MDKKQFLVVVLAALAVLSAVDGKTKKKKKPPVDFDEGDSFSNVEHFPDGKHDPMYDQQAFLGEEQADAMKGLTKEETHQKLKTLFPKIDIDNDGKVSRKELAEWVVDNVKKHVAKNTKERMADMDANKDGKVTWDEFEKDQEKFKTGSVESEFKHADQMKQEKKRFQAADSDGDNTLNADELSVFLHPEESPRMISLLVEENIHTMDKNKDGLVSIEEYIGLGGSEELDKETDDSLRETFNNDLDKNKDGKLDKDEIKHWLFPGGDKDPIIGEVDHLMTEADGDKDNYLSLKEILDNDELFAGGRATQYGELLKNDEL